MTTDHPDFDSGHDLDDENGYTPDPERDTAALLDAFFEHLANTVHTRSLPAELTAEMRVLHQELEAANEHRIGDEPSRYNLRLTLALVAAYRLLLPHLHREDALALIETAFVEPLGETLRTATAAMLDHAPDPFAAMVALSKSREVQYFGETFTFVRSADDDRRYLLDVHRCFYHEVLVANSAPELTPAMCAFDGNWIRAIDPERHGLRFERPTTIGYGGATCPFHFHRTESAEPAED
ncbi:L-2-amino-thiazoline-4-carboxylic acid hydrolase [Embleya sp. AB8]|uniref:L-2-amino-thiazoline-4-carboxylic acid hydrolase n=1 Tax=Embleya sp. AB8 TaxID=3156304 RepID=UPI003C7168BD